ncbi:MAG: hypothetical protein HY749_17365 [Gammaproteobacteria bacterium]|nr:hypothetical protein [Gammaproteobacteria bacterium]
MNPEFQRNLWLEFTMQRVLTLCGTLLALFVLTGLFDAHGPGGMVPIAALAAFVGVAVAWGGHLAGESVLDELRDRTWDQQRMSALDPWSMTWGKLFGATSVAWTGGALSLAAYLGAQREALSLHPWLVAAACVAGAVFVQGLSLLGALTLARRSKRVKTVFGSRVAAALLAIGWAYLAGIARGEDALDWYGIAWPRLPFTVVALALFAAWAVFGAYRMMCEELQVPTRPWVWLTFLLYVTGFIGGFLVGELADPLRALRVLAALGVVVCCGGSYLAAFALYRDPLVFRRLVTYWRAGAGRRVAEEVPVWAVSLALAGVFAVLSTLLALGGPLTVTKLESLGPATLPVWLYALRDLCLLVAFGYGPRPERAEVSTLIWLALLYWLVPGILKMLHFTALAALVLPPVIEAPYRASLALATQIAVCAVFLAASYRRRIVPPATQLPGATL